MVLTSAAADTAAPLVCLSAAARVLRGGTIRVGDAVTVQAQPEEAQT